MKKQLLTLLLMTATAFLCFSQKKQKDTAKVHLPIKDGSVHFEKIIDSLPGNKTEIYNASLKWLADSFEDSKEVIRVKDVESGTIIGAGSFRLIIPGFVSTDQLVTFRCELNIKDNKARIKLYQFPIDDQYQKYLAEKQWPKANRKYYEFFNINVNGLMESYRSYLRNNSKPDDF